jgi:ParB family chromosome partitioning protein
MTISLDSVVIRRRIRKDLGDIEGLMESLRRHGQLHPIIINRRHELIAGFRRLEAARRLGWTGIQAVIVDRETEDTKLEIEIEENIQRQNLSPDEIATGLERLQRLRHPGLLRRIWNFLVRLVRRIFGRRKANPRSA